MCYWLLITELVLSSLNCARISLPQMSALILLLEWHQMSSGWWKALLGLNLAVKRNIAE